MAEKLGYEQSYLSAIEVGTKGPPTDEFLERLIQRLELNGEWQRRLRDSLAASQRRIMLPAQASEDVYRLCHELRQQLSQLHPAQIELIRFALRLPHQIDGALASGLCSSGQSKGRNIREVAKM